MVAINCNGQGCRAAKLLAMTGGVGCGGVVLNCCGQQQLRPKDGANRF